MIDLTKLQARVSQMCDDKHWDKDWLKGGGYMHLEVSEFMESLRGKGDDPPEKEAADVLFCLLAVMAHYDLKIEDAIKELDKMVP
jgi:NTP pyrophosphatase (non-canonical NTP hydrolase)